MFGSKVMELKEKVSVNAFSCQAALMKLSNKDTLGHELGYI